MDKKIKLILIFGFVLVVFLMGYNIRYYHNFKKDLQDFDIAEEMKKLEEEESNSLENLVKKANEELEKIKETDLSGEDIYDNFTEDEVEEFYKVYEENRKEDYVLPPNAHMRELTEEIENSYRALIMSLIRQYQFEEASRKTTEISTQYNLIDNPEFSSFILDASNMYVFEDYSVEDKTTFISLISDPEIYAYAFFSLELDEKYEVVLDKKSLALNTLTHPPKFISIEEVPPRKHNADRYFLSLKGFTLYRMQFEVTEGNIYLYVIKDNNGLNRALLIESIDIEDYTTMEQYFSFYN